MSKRNLRDLIIAWRRESDEYYLRDKVEVSLVYTECANALQLWIESDFAEMIKEWRAEAAEIDALLEQKGVVNE